MTRDEILARALDMVDSKALDQKDRPGGAMQGNALSTAWLQDGLDLFHRAFPWSGVIAVPPATLSLTTTTNSYTLPADYTMDVKNGVKIVQAGPPRINKRLFRRPLTWLLNRDATSYCTGEPSDYVIIGTNVVVYPWPNAAYAGQLWYYQLPGVLAPNERPNFPDDWTLVEYVRLRGKEWTGEEAAETAIKYARGIIAELKKSGLGEESEDDALQMDATHFRPSGSGSGGESYDWMGRTTAS